MSDCVCLPKDATIELIDANLGEKTITENGRYLASSDDLDGYSAVDVNVSQSFTQEDEGKVVSNGSLVSQSSATYTENDTYDTTTVNSVTVNVSGGGDNAYKFIDNSFSGEYVNNLISSIRNYALSFCTGHDFSFSSSSATSIGYNAFQGANITSFSAPNLTGAANNASTFNSAKKLTFADMGSLAKIYGNFAYNANALTVLVLRHTSVVTLDNVNAFGNTPIRGYNGRSGTIYVPSALIDSYKSASNWSSIFNEGYVTFTAIEGSIYE